MKKIIESDFDLGDIVWHIVKCEKAVITDISYSYLSNNFRYYCSYGFSESGWCENIELSKEKVINLD